MLYTVYVLYSASFQKIYVGFTSDLLQRFKSHNYLGTKDWTKSYRPWEVVYCECFDHKSEAMRREKE